MVNPVYQSATVTAFQPDPSGKVFVVAQTNDGGSVRLLLSIAERGTLNVGSQIVVAMGPADPEVQLAPAPEVALPEVADPAPAEPVAPPAAEVAPVEATETGAP